MMEVNSVEVVRVLEVFGYYVGCLCMYDRCENITLGAQ
jgi:hypothetical protein